MFFSVIISFQNLDTHFIGGILNSIRYRTLFKCPTILFGSKKQFLYSVGKGGILMRFSCSFFLPPKVTDKRYILVCN